MRPPGAAAVRSPTWRGSTDAGAAGWSRGPSPRTDRGRRTAAGGQGTPPDVVDPGPPLHLEVEVLASFAPIAERVRAGRVDLVAVDMPMGLAERDRRRCDIEARRLLGPRRGSVFPTPVRAVLDCETYAEALSVSRAVCGRGLSKQAWFLVPKIRELDGVVRDLPAGALLEVHPELAFAALGGGPMADPKRTAAGRAAAAGGAGTGDRGSRGAGRHAAGGLGPGRRPRRLRAGVVGAPLGARGRSPCRP